MQEQNRVIVETLELKFPFEYKVKDANGERQVRLECLEFSRLKAADLEDMVAQGMKVKDFFLPLARATALPQSIIKQLDSEDLMAAIEVIGGFLGGGQKTGESP